MGIPMGRLSTPNAGSVGSSEGVRLIGLPVRVAPVLFQQPTGASGLPPEVRDVRP